MKVINKVTWVLKAREPDRSFLSMDGDDDVRFVSKASAARKFSSAQEAEQFANKVSSKAKVEAWNSRAPQLLPIRIDARSFIVDFWEVIFRRLGEISLFHAIQRVSQKLKLQAYTQSYVFVEIWVLLWNLISVLFLIVATSHFQQSPVGYLLLFFGAWRVFEIIIYHVNVMFLDEYRTLKNPAKPPYAVRGFRRLVILAVHNYFEILVWFAGFYAYVSCAFKGGSVLRSPIGALYHSIVTMSTLGYGNIHPIDGSLLGVFLACTQTLIGIFLAIVVFARVVAMIPCPLTMDEFER